MWARSYVYMRQPIRTKTQNSKFRIILSGQSHHVKHQTTTTQQALQALEALSETSRSATQSRRIVVHIASFMSRHCPPSRSTANCGEVFGSLLCCSKELKAR